MTSERSLYRHPAAMEPLTPRDSGGNLRELAAEVIRTSAELGGLIHPITREGVVDIVRSMNSYYSNLIEGHNTHPLDIDRALRSDYSGDPAKRALQLESRAHIDLQRRIEQRLVEDPHIEICSREFLCWIHREFYEHLPPEFCIVKTEKGGTDTVIPGELRTGQVIVGRHIGPAADSLPRFLERFAEVYSPDRVYGHDKVLAAAASHHRLAWIHPFLDGNGRVARLFTHAYFIKSKIDGHRLWMVSRGLARSRDKYIHALQTADAERYNDLDGRGNLSDKGLFQFSTFFLDTCLDQIKFMSSLLHLDSLHERLSLFVEKIVDESKWNYLRKKSDKIILLLSTLFYRGEITRGEAASILSMIERTSFNVIAFFIDRGLLTSAGAGKPLRLGFPPQAVGYYFPDLYPTGIEIELREAPTSSRKELKT